MSSHTVLEWISVYWFSRAGPAASVRIYYEVANAAAPPRRSAIPCGLSFFPQELGAPPRTYVPSLPLLHRPSLTVVLCRWARTVGNVVFEAEHEAGGHFAAFERPQNLAADVRAMFGKGGPAFGVVPGKSGYN